VELEYSDKNRRRSKLYIAVGMIVALVVAATVFVALQASGLTTDGTLEMRSVVVAVRDIPARKTIEEGDVAVREVVADPTNETAFARLDEVLGRVAGIPVSTGQLVNRNVLASTTEGQAFSILDLGDEFDPSGPDWRAVSLTVVDANAVGGTLVSGQVVDLIVTMPLNPEVGQTEQGAADQATTVVPGPSTKVTLQTVTVLARNGDVYIVRADLETAEKIAELLAVGGIFTMALRPAEDDRTADTEGSTIDRLVEEFGFPVPAPLEVAPSQAADAEGGG
jgi:Flp pilus assembly protein CpaB